MGLPSLHACREKSQLLPRGPRLTLVRELSFVFSCKRVSRLSIALARNVHEREGPQ